MLVIVGCLIMFAMAASIIYFVLRHQRKMHENERRIQAIENERQIALFKASMEAEERQKEVIARNLHDTINPMLSQLKYSLTSHQSVLLDNNIDHGILDKDKQLIENVIKDIRGICHNLIPQELDTLGLIKALEEIIERIQKSGVIAASCNSSKLSYDPDLIPKPEQVNIYRVCQELINNILKHADGNQLHLQVFSLPEKLCFEFGYNGNGITDTEVEELSKKGLGLNSLQTRVLILNARLNYHRTDDGFGIKFHIPIAA